MFREETKRTKGPALCCPLEATRWMLGIAGGCVLPSVPCLLFSRTDAAALAPCFAFPSTAFFQRVCLADAGS